MIIAIVQANVNPKNQKTMVKNSKTMRKTRSNFLFKTLLQLNIAITINKTEIDCFIYDEMIRNIKTLKTRKPPEGWDLIEPQIAELQQRLREWKRKTVLLKRRWQILE